MHRPTVPRGLPIAGVVLIVLGVVALQVIPRVATPEQLAKNVLLSAIPFILIFAAIIILYISFIWALATALKEVISARTYNIVMKIIIAGILLGIVGMFQPWAMVFYTYGFVLLLFSTLTYIVWSHITPKVEDVQEEARGDHIRSNA
jgi:H+/Cl- antiporter ClcA